MTELRRPESAVSGRLRAGGLGSLVARLERSVPSRASMPAACPPAGPRRR